MFSGFTTLFDTIQTSATQLIGTLLGLMLVLGALVIVGLSIAMMFSDEQSSMRYKHWRANVFKAVVVAGIAYAVLQAIKTGLDASGMWGVK